MQTFLSPETTVPMAWDRQAGALTKIPGVSIPSEILGLVIYQYQRAHEIHKMNVIEEKV